MIYVQARRLRNPLARRREVVEANLSALFGNAQEQARLVLERHHRAEPNGQGNGSARRRVLELPQLRISRGGR